MLAGGGRGLGLLLVHGVRQAGKTRVRKVIARRSPRIVTKATDAVFDALDAQSVTLPGETT